MPGEGMDNVADARAVIEIMLTADHECHDCAGNLLAAFYERFPAHRALAGQMYEAAFPGRTLEDYDRAWRSEHEAWMADDAE